MSGGIQICLSVWVDVFYVCLVYGNSSLFVVYALQHIAEGLKSTSGGNFHVFEGKIAGNVINKSY